MYLWSSFGVKESFYSIPKKFETRASIDNEHLMQCLPKKEEEEEVKTFIQTAYESLLKE